MSVKNSSNFRWIMLLLVVFNNVFIAGFTATSLAVLFPIISNELNWTPLQVASVWGALPLGTVLFVFISGVLLDKLSVRWMMFSAVFIASIAIFMRGYVSDFAIFYVIMFLLGIMASIFNPGNNKIISLWFERREIYKVTGFLISGTTFGMFFGYNFAIPMMNAVGGWRNMYMIIGAVIAIISLLWVFVAKERATAESALSKSSGNDGMVSETTFWENIKVILTHKQAWHCYIADAFFIGLIMIFLGMAPTVFKQEWGVSTQMAGTITSMANAGSLFGYLILPTIVEKFGLRKPFIGPAMLITVLFWTTALLSKNITVAMILIALGGFLNGISVPGPRTVLLEQREIGGLRAGTAIGFLIMCSNLAVTLLSTSFGFFTQVTNNYSLSLSIIIGLGIISVISMLTVKETGIRKVVLKNHSEVIPK